METYYRINGLLKFSVEDNYNEGCDPETSSTVFIEMEYKGTSPQDVINKCASYLGVDSDGIEKNACGEKGRVDFSLMEDSDSNPASKNQLTNWKNNEQKLWSVTYSGKVEKVTITTPKI
jgi:hypothetical protein